MVAANAVSASGLRTGNTDDPSITTANAIAVTSSGPAIADAMIPPSSRGVRLPTPAEPAMPAVPATTSSVGSSGSTPSVTPFMVRGT